MHHYALTKWPIRGKKSCLALFLCVNNAGFGGEGVAPRVGEGRALGARVVRWSGKRGSCSAGRFGSCSGAARVVLWSGDGRALEMRACLRGCEGCAPLAVCVGVCLRRAFSGQALRDNKILINAEGSFFGVIFLLSKIKYNRHKSGHASAGARGSCYAGRRGQASAGLWLL